MKLYYSKGVCSLAVRIILNEVGATFDSDAVDLKTKKTDKDENFLEINPKGYVPALLLDNGELLTENTAIQQYLADQYQAIKLLPPVGELKRYRVLEWLNYVSTEMHKGMSPLFNPNVPAEVKESVFISLLKQRLAFLDKYLTSQEYLTGSEFTLPDAYLFVVLTWLPGLKINISEWQNVSDYFDRIKNRASVQKSLKEEGLGS